MVIGWKFFLGLRLIYAPSITVTEQNRSLCNGGGKQTRWVIRVVSRVIQPLPL
jgi:hypothetical protein